MHKKIKRARQQAEKKGDVVGMKNQEEQIVKKALEYGYENCGIIGIDEMSGFADKLRERMEKAPGNDEFYGGFLRFANLRETHPWAKSLVVCIVKYGYYVIPEHLNGMIGKHYLVDIRTNESCKEYKTSVAFENYLQSLGLKVETNRRFGVTAMRWAALKAGLGIARRNNFFYTDSGSWIHIEAFLTDGEMELKQTPAGKPCPQDCNRCMEACPTNSLSEPYTMSPAICVSPMSVRGDDLVDNPLGKSMGKWIYGCDACQDACPHNAEKWAQIEEFPGLAELARAVTLENIIQMDDEQLAELLASKFFYIEEDRIWQWKINALNAMLNDYDERYADAIRGAMNDPNERVRRMANWVAESCRITPA
jgi:epoxyqueuosine reductase